MSFQTQSPLYFAYFSFRNVFSSQIFSIVSRLTIILLVRIGVKICLTKNLMVFGMVFRFLSLTNGSQILTHTISIFIMSNVVNKNVNTRLKIQKTRQAADAAIDA